jgi:putative transposase
LYNQSLEKDKSLKYYEQKRNLTQKRKVIATLKRVHSQVLQNVVWRLAACKAEVIIVDPSNTTQRCSCCGSMPEKKIFLKVRVYKCSSCGLVLNRDHNAALEILRKGLEQTHMEKLPLLDKTSKLFRGSMNPTSSL